jgi:hypothetical protein
VTASSAGAFARADRRGDAGRLSRRQFRKVVLKNFDMSLGTGQAKVKGKLLRIGHIGHFNDLRLMGTLSGIEMGLDLLPGDTYITATRVTSGFICLSSSSHFAASVVSNIMKPVILPPGRARPATNPYEIGSMISANTIGMVRVVRRSALATWVTNSIIIVPTATLATTGRKFTNRD